MPKKEQKRKTPTKSSSKVDVDPSEKAFRHGKHYREGTDVLTSEPMRINAHERQSRRSKKEIEKVVKKYEETGKIPSRYKRVKRGNKTKRIRNPDFIRDKRILERRNLI